MPFPQRNQHAPQISDEIMNNPRSCAEISMSIMNVGEPLGRGSRFRAGGTFIGFLEPEALIVVTIWSWPVLLANVMACLFSSLVMPTTNGLPKYSKLRGQAFARLPFLWSNQFLWSYFGRHP